MRSRSVKGSFCRRSPRLALILLACALSACGGGGGSSSGNSSTGGTGGGSGGGSSQPPTVTVDNTQFSATVAPTGAAPNYQAHFAITDPSGAAIYFAYTDQRTAIAAISPSWPNPTAGQSSLTLSFALYAPAIMGSGTFTDEIEVEFCLDQQCQTQISGSPITISVTYTITGNVVSNETYVVTPSSIWLESPDSAASASAAITVAAIDGLPPYTTYLFGQSKANGVVASGSWAVNESGTPTGTLTVNLKSPSSIGPGVYSDTIVISVCYDQACTKEALGSPWTLPVTYIVDASAGVDYTAQMLAATAADIAYSSVTQKLYAVTTSYSTQLPSTLLEIDPTTATVTRSLALTAGQDPIVLSVSDDGSYAYVGFSDQGVVERVAISTMTLDTTISLPVDPTYGAPFAGYLLAMPGAPHTWAVSMYTNATGLTDFDSRGTYLFTDGTQLANTFLAPDASTRVMALTFGSDSSTLYAFDGNQARLFTAATSANGLALSSEVTGVNIEPDIYYLGGSLYGDGGTVVNAATGATAAQFLTPLSVIEPVITLDSTLNRAYFYYQDQTTPNPLWTFATYNLQTQAIRELTRVSGCTLFPGGVNGKVGRIVRFGSNGLALNCREGIEIIAGIFVTN
jgi:hypothetical protein